MKTLLIILFVLDAILLIGLLVFVAVRSKKDAVQTPVSEPVAQPAPAVEPVVAPAPVAEVAPVVEQAPAQEVVEQQPATEERGLVITAVEDDDDDRESAKPVPFCEKMLYIDRKTQDYFNVLNNEFISLRKINDRVSAKGVSYRLGRELVAKITVRGKTMKLHLALPVADFPANVYFQKDMSDVKAYAEVPFTVKVKSDRGLKNALKLIAALAQVKQIEKKTRFTPVDAMEELKALAAQLR